MQIFFYLEIFLDESVFSHGPFFGTTIFRSLLFPIFLYTFLIMVGARIFLMKSTISLTHAHNFPLSLIKLLASFTFHQYNFAQFVDNMHTRNSNKF